MFLSRLHRRITAWVALLALVLGALAPTVAQAALAGSERADWMQVCSVSGMVWVQADTGQVRDQQRGGQAPMGDASQHCPWCTLHGGTLGLPAAAHTPPALAPRLTGLPPAFYTAPLTATAWAPPPSRAPPLAA